MKWLFIVKLLKTPLYETHEQSGAKFVDFSGWDMPIYYTSQIEEHHSVRQDKGMFDVSHMLAIDVLGEDAYVYLEYMIANDLSKLAVGKALYTCMLNEKGGIIDDLIVYCLSNQHYRIVINAGNRESDCFWLQKHLKKGVRVVLKKLDDQVILAIQGPNAREALHQSVIEVWPNLRVEQLKTLMPFSLYTYVEKTGASSPDCMIARTGYTGEEGYEIILSAKNASLLVDALISRNVPWIGLGARDTLRLEAGLNLYNADMDETITPFECGLSWTVSLNKNTSFIGQKALQLMLEKNGQQHELFAVILKEKGVLRCGMSVINEIGCAAKITSAAFSPTLGHSIAFVRAPVHTKRLFVQMKRHQKIIQYELNIVKAPFVRKGKLFYKEINHEDNVHITNRNLSHQVCKNT